LLRGERLNPPTANFGLTTGKPVVLNATSFGNRPVLSIASIVPIASFRKSLDERAKV
jgi:hypothetical protein